jgi:hypothetical protein
MLIGIDFDNTIVCYDTLFHTAACEQGLIPHDVPANKSAVRDYLRGSGRERAWVDLQGFVYGPGLAHAECFSGVWDFFRVCAAHDAQVKIVSHKTRRAVSLDYDLHASAMTWLRHQFAIHRIPFDLDATVHMEETRAAKLARIAALGCDWFIDDLPELFLEPGFPAGVKRLLFDTTGTAHLPERTERAASWPEITAKIFAASVR